MDYDDPKVEERWCSDRRKQVLAYLVTEQVAHGQVGDWPAWHLAPYASIWAVESLANPGWVGWWVICGDLPSDYLSASTIKHPRDAMLAFATRWHKASELMAKGQESPDFLVGSREQWPTLAPLLASRAALLQQVAADKAQWVEP